MEAKQPYVFKSAQSFMQVMTPAGERVIFVDHTFKTGSEKLAEWIKKDIVPDPAMGVYPEGEEPGHEDQVKNDPAVVKAQLDAWRQTQLEANGQVSQTTPGDQAASTLGAASSQSSAAMGRTSGGSSFQETPQQSAAGMAALRQRLAQATADKEKDKDDGKQSETGEGDSGKASVSSADAAKSE